MFKKSAGERLKLDRKYEQMYYILTFFSVSKSAFVSKNYSLQKECFIFSLKYLWKTSINCQKPVKSVC